MIIWYTSQIQSCKIKGLPEGPSGKAEVPALIPKVPKKERKVIINDGYVFNLPPVKIYIIIMVLQKRHQMAHFWCACRSMRHSRFYKGGAIEAGQINLRRSLLVLCIWNLAKFHVGYEFIINKNSIGISFESLLYLWCLLPLIEFLYETLAGLLRRLRDF